MLDLLVVLIREKDMVVVVELYVPINTVVYKEWYWSKLNKKLDILVQKNFDSDAFFRMNGIINVAIKICESDILMILILLGNSTK